MSRRWTVVGDLVARADALDRLASGSADLFMAEDAQRLARSLRSVAARSGPTPYLPARPSSTGSLTSGVI